MTDKVIMKDGWPAYSCERCMGERWVCEAHPDKPWHKTKGCVCSAGEPCPDCNSSDGEDDPPDTGGAIKNITATRDKGRVN